MYELSVDNTNRNITILDTTTVEISSSLYKSTIIFTDTDKNITINISDKIRLLLLLGCNHFKLGLYPLKNNGIFVELYYTDKEQTKGLTIYTSIYQGLSPFIVDIAVKDRITNHVLRKASIDFPLDLNKYNIEHTYKSKVVINRVLYTIEETGSDILKKIVQSKHSELTLDSTVYIDYNKNEKVEIIVNNHEYARIIGRHMEQLVAKNKLEIDAGISIRIQYSTLASITINEITGILKNKEDSSLINGRGFTHSVQW